MSLFLNDSVQSYIQKSLRSQKNTTQKYVSFSEHRFISEILKLDTSSLIGEMKLQFQGSAISLLFSNRDDFVFIASKGKPETLHSHTRGLSIRWREVLPPELLGQVVLIDQTNLNWKKTLAHELRHARNKILMKERFPEYAEGSVNSMLVLAKDEIIAYLSNPEKTTEKIFDTLSEMGGLYFYPMNNYYFAGIPKEKRDIMWGKYLPKLKKLCSNADKVRKLEKFIPGLDYLDLLAVIPGEKWKYLPNFIRLMKK